jgi:hypothetical protein
MRRDCRLRLFVPAVLCLSGVRAVRAQEVVWEFDGKADRRWMGSAVAKVQDRDGDGVSEVLVGAIDIDALGKAKLLSGIDGRVLLDRDGPPFDPGLGNSRFGTSVAGVGDLVGDGVDEFLVTAPAAVDANGDGVDDWVIASPHDADSSGHGGGSVELHSGAGGALPWRIFGSGFDKFGTGLAGIDDFDGDGIADVLVGAPQNFCGHGYAPVASGVDGRTLHTWTGSELGGLSGRA